MSDEITLLVSTCSQRESPPPGDKTYTESASRSITGWTSISLSRGVERCPSGFSIEYTEPYEDVGRVLVSPGDKVVVKLGSDVVLTGFCDRMTPSLNAQSHMVRLEGRSTAQDLVDCSAKWDGGQMLNVSVPQIARNLCQAYGITVNVAAGTNVGDPIKQLNILTGETPLDLIERVCRVRGLLFFDQPDGSVIISGIGTQQMASGFAEGVNVQSASIVYAMDGRFSTYDACYLGLDVLQDQGDGGNLFATVTDPGVPRYRRRVIISENMYGGKVVAEKRANWEMARRIGRSSKVTLTTDSWRDSAGTLWQPNSCVDVSLPTLKLRPQRWIISDVTYKRSLESGTTADLVIMPPQAFAQQPMILNPIASDYNKAQ